MEEACGLLAEGAAEDDRLHHHHRAAGAELGQRRRDFAGDIRAPDYHHTLAGGILPDRIRVGERAQVVNPVELGSGHVQPPDIGASGDQRLAEPDLLLV